MDDRVSAGTWVEIRSVVLPAGERAPQVPADTQRVHLEMRTKGFLVEAAAIGDEVEVTTSTGRPLRGVLAVVNPAYTHGFGPAVPELLTIGREVRALLRRRERPA
jgi:hypothetical protein